MMGQPIQQSCRHLGVTEHTGPFGKAQIGGNHDTGALIQLREQVEQQCPAGLTEGQIPQFIQDHQIHMGETEGQLTLLARRLLPFQNVDEFGGAQGQSPFMTLFVCRGGVDCIPS